MGRALIVSAGASSNEYICARLTELGYTRPLIVPSGAEARRRMLESDFELIVVNAPLPDEFGHDLCATAVEKTDAGVVFLVKAAAAEQLLTPMSEQGVLLVCKAVLQHACFCRPSIWPRPATTACSCSGRRSARMQEKIAQVRLVSRAKCCLVEREQMSEAAAHRYIEKRAMDTRRDRTEIAQEILDSYEDGCIIWCCMFYCGCRRIRTGKESS